MNVFKFEFKREYKTTILWGLLLSVLLFVFMSFFPAFEKEAIAFKQVLDNFPQEMLQAVGLDVETLFTFEGFLSYVYMYVMLALSIYGMTLAIKTFGREKINHSSDFVLSKPISRIKLFLMKLSSNLILILVLFVILFITLKLFSENYFNQTVFNLFGSGFLILLFFYGLGALLSQVFNKLRNPIGISTAIVFSFYIIMMMSRILENDLLKSLTPFGILDQNDILFNRLPTIRVIGLIGVTFLLLLSSLLIMDRRDV